MGTRDRGQKPGRDSAPLTNRPLAGPLKGVRPSGPSCLVCNGPIDTRTSWSLGNTSGSRRCQRQGWIHTDCQEKEEVKFHQVTWAPSLAPNRPGQPNVYNKTVVVNNTLAVPVFTQTELDQLMSGEDT